MVFWTSKSHLLATLQYACDIWQTCPDCKGLGYQGLVATPPTQVIMHCTGCCGNGVIPGSAIKSGKTES